MCPDVKLNLEFILHAFRDDREAEEDDIGARTVPDSNSSRRPYFKGYRLIPGSQKTHDTAILEMSLDYMTNRQVIE